MNANGKKFVVAKEFQHLDASRSLGAGVQATGFPSIGIRGKMWSLRYNGEEYPFVREDDGSPLTYLDVVVVGANEFQSKIFFGADKFDENNTTGPICQSLKTDVPDPGVPQPQNKDCPSCRWHEWGSHPQGKGRACQDHVKASVLLMPKMVVKMLGAPLYEPVYFKVPPGSLKAWKAYGEMLSHENVPFAAIVTRISFTPGKLFQFSFEPRETLPGAAAKIVLPLLVDNSTQTRTILGLTGAHARALPKPQPEEQSAGDELLEHFGNATPTQSMQETTTPAKRGRGRPPGSTNKPKQIDGEAIPPSNGKPAVQEEADPWEEAAKAKPAPTQATPDDTWEDSDDETDKKITDGVDKILGDKMKEMM